ncbi:MAG: sigma-70 family RNA polymerase sigma factor [Spirochaetales bacterium]
MTDVEALYRRYGPMVHRRCRALLGEEGAADASQEVFVRLLRTGSRLEDRGLCSLLYTLATHQSLNVLRAEKSRPGFAASDLLEEIACLDEGEDRTLATDLLERVFHQHPASSRMLATLHWVDGLTLEETAQAVGLSVSGVRKRLAKLKESGRLLKEAPL